MKAIDQVKATKKRHDCRYGLIAVSQDAPDPDTKIRMWSSNSIQLAKVLPIVERT